MGAAHVDVTISSNAAHAQDLNVLYNFQGAGPDGATPNRGMIPDRAGNFYGSTTYGESPGAGTVFRIAPDGYMGRQSEMRGS